MTIRTGSWNHISLIVPAMAHNVSLHARCLYKDHLATSRVAFLILDARQRLCRNTSTVHNDLGGGTGIRSLDAGEPLSHKMHAVLLLESAKEILNVLGSIECQGGEGYAEPDARRKFLGRQFSELWREVSNAVKRSDEIRIERQQDLHPLDTRLWP